MNQLVLMMSCDKNQGKTLMAITLANVLSRESKVLLIDVTTSKKTIASYLGVEEQIVYDVGDMMLGTCQMDSAIMEVRIGEVVVDFIPAPRMRTKIYNRAELIEKLSILPAQKYDFIIIDGIELCSTDYYYDYTSINYLIMMIESKIEDLKKINIATQKIGKEALENTYFVLSRYHKTLYQKGQLLSGKEIEEMMNISIIGQIDEEKRFESIDRYTELPKEILEPFLNMANQFSEIFQNHKISQ